ncbi:MAG: hypothetical protein KF814_08975 [Nitrospiraceae bacterium]|nr:hypothetical protein [Nitrospiraceae bacterium]
MGMRMVTIVIGLLLMGLTGCSGHHHGAYGGGKGDYYWDKAGKDVGSLVEKHVKDPEKVKQVNAVMGEIIVEIKTSREQNRQYHRRLYELNAQYDAAPEEFTKILDELNNSRMRSAAKILGLRFKMKNLLSAEEWKALSDEMKSYGSRYYGKSPEGAHGAS